MKVIGAILVSVLCASLSSGCTRASAAEPRVVVVELFTSEGCSSCPPADAVLAGLESSQPLAHDGVSIVPLAFHVDYWDELGWKDPFSSHDWTRRQLGYRNQWEEKGTSLYTPQLVIDGREELNGSDRKRAEQAIAEAARRMKTRVSLSVERNVVAVRTGPMPSGSAPADLVLAVVEPSVSVKVTEGENKGRTLSHTAVVRALVPLGPAKPEGGSMSKTLEGVDLIGRRAVVLLQERRSRAIVGVAVTPLG